MRVTEDRSKPWVLTMAERGRLPNRYAESMLGEFHAFINLRPGMAVLDVGAGRAPIYSVDKRPAGLTYVGLDISAEELHAAPPGSYDEVVVADISNPHPELNARFDLILSWQVLEHVRPLDRAISNLREWLIPGGELVAVLSGRYAAFALANRLLPSMIGSRIASRVLGIPIHDVFPAAYDRCYASALEGMFADWSEADIQPLFRGAVYFRPLGPLLRAYVAYESWAARTSRADLATHYLVHATR